MDMDSRPATDAYGDALTFTLLDELARASERGFVRPADFLASRRIAELGPMMELMLLDRKGALPLDALQSDDPLCLQQLANEGIMQVQSKDFAAAVDHLRQAYDGYRQLKYSEDSPPLQIFSFYMACAQPIAQQRREEAGRSWKRASFGKG
jgi:hypothetical protein